MGLAMRRDPDGQRSDQGQGQRQRGQPPAEGEGRGHGADEQRAAGVTEFPPDLGGAHGLAESLRRGGAARCAKATGVAIRVPAPISTAAIRIPPTVGSGAAANRPAAAIPMPAVMPNWSGSVPASRARPARGCTTTAVTARRDTTAPVIPGVIPARADDGEEPVASAAAAVASVMVGRRKFAARGRRARSNTVCRRWGKGRSCCVLDLDGAIHFCGNTGGTLP